MLKAIRKRLTYANVAMTLALVFAMTGGAYAASKVLITSTKQISPKVLKSLKGAKGANGANGTNGAAGVGTAGATGPQGPGGSQGPKGETGTKGEQGVKGENGTNGTTGFTETLPKGKTETGTWVLGPGNGSEASVPISFNIPLVAGAEPQVKVLKKGEGETEECPGTEAAPKAAKGFVCLYTLFEKEEPPAPAGQASGATGVLLVYAPVKIGALQGGTWAVTAE